MKNVIKKTMLFIMVMGIILATCSVNGFTSEAKSKSKVANGTYHFSSNRCKKFVVKNKKLSIQVTGDGITKDGNDSFSKKTMKIPVAKNCKYYEKYFDRSNGQSATKKCSYKIVNKNISYDRKYFRRTGYNNNVGLSSFVVKNGKVVKVIYFFM